MAFVSTKLGQFRYFDQQLGRPEWKGKRVLDFGGNCGSFLRDAGAAIDPQLYWCIDVSRDAILQGKQCFPEAHWSFYNRHNLQFNPTGVKHLMIPDIDQEFDFVLAYSVFTHTSKAEMIELVTQLRGMLSTDGLLAFTFLDPGWSAFEGDPFPGSNLRWRLQVNKEDNPWIDIELSLARSRGREWVTLVDDELYLEEGSRWEPEPSADERTYTVLCDPQHMKTIFPEAEILPPAAPERQHCCIIRRP